MDSEYESTDNCDCFSCKCDSNLSATGWVLFLIFSFMGGVLGIIFFGSGKEKFIIDSAPAILVISFFGISGFILMLLCIGFLCKKKEEIDQDLDMV
jgi:hypothetical protein